MHVVVSGQVRHLAGYRLLLQRLAAARGALESVTLVHWNGQAELVRELLAAHPGAADRLMLLDEPQVQAPGSFFHQVSSLDQGMAGRADGDMVLRLRPDNFVDEAFLPNIAAALDVLDRPLWSPFADLTCPFFACDIAFAGRASALRAQSNYSVEPYLLPVPSDAERVPGQVYSHEPEVQRWLHPARGLDWRTQALWTLFPHLGFATGHRAALMSRFAGWDAYQAMRTAWLEYIVDHLALGGLAEVGRLGLLRAETPTSERAAVQWLDSLNEPADLCSDQALAREGHAYLWTAQVDRVRAFLAFVADRNLPARPLTPSEARLELADIWRAAQAAPEWTAPPPRPGLPYALSGIAFTPD